MASSLFLFSVSLIIVHLSLTTAQPTFNNASCSNTGNYVANSVFQSNLNLTLSSLLGNATRGGGFYNTSSGQSPDIVYGLFQCRVDVSPELCQSCIRNSTVRIISECPSQKEAFIWYDECTLRYANRYIFADTALYPRYEICNPTDITVDDQPSFSGALTELMNSLITKAVSGNSSEMFAADSRVYVSGRRLYGLVQCNPDISQSDCQTCLSGFADISPPSCNVSQGGRRVRLSCSIRYEWNPFYNETAVIERVLTHSVPSLPPPPPPPPRVNSNGKRSNISRTVIVIIAATVTSLILIVSICVFLRMKKPWANDKSGDEITSAESLRFDFGTIRDATDNFSDENKLGQGGFGAVYKGRLPNGEDIAVKRLSMGSVQGEQEFKNEVVLVAKLQHRNLVRLLGFCLKGNERLLIYEFLPNKSLNHFIFDPTTRAHLDWEIRYKIIGGIARGLLYLHEDSRLRIIHRDLKASNILLDEEMNPKISDFGMARLFLVDQTQGDTNRIVGTYGYMAPEYAFHGNFSVKSDVFSFGVLVLEIVSGQENNCFRVGEDVEDLKSYAWKTWMEGTATNLIDTTLGAADSTTEIMKCIHIGLLCVQENVANRPTMASVVVMLNSNSITLPVPSRPAYFMYSSSKEGEMPFLQDPISGATESVKSQSKSADLSVNETSIKEINVQ